MDEITPQLRDRLQPLLEQAKSDRSALERARLGDGERALAQLFDALADTLHNLEQSEAAAEAGDGASR